MLTFAILVLAGCSSDPIRVKPNGALTIPAEKVELIEGDTVRDLAEKFELRGMSIDEANKRFQLIRE